MTAPAAHRLVLDGELTIQVAAELRSTLLNSLEAADTIEIDLSAVSEMDTAGLQLLLALREQAGELGRTVLLLNPSPVVQEVLALTRLDLRLDQIVGS